jgi:hypothetical protein
MKKWLLVIGLLMIVGTGGFLTLSFYGAKLLRTELQKSLGPGLHVTEIKVKLTHLSLREIRYDDPTLKKRFFEVEEIRIYPALLASLQGTVGIRKVLLLSPLSSSPGLKKESGPCPYPPVIRGRRTGTRGRKGMRNPRFRSIGCRSRKVSSR